MHIVEHLQLKNGEHIPNQRGKAHEYHNLTGKCNEKWAVRFVQLSSDSRERN